MCNDKVIFSIEVLYPTGTSKPCEVSASAIGDAYRPALRGTRRFRVDVTPSEIAILTPNDTGSTILPVVGQNRRNGRQE